jgi:hypothetical protein
MSGKEAHPGGWLALAITLIIARWHIFSTSRLFLPHVPALFLTQDQHEMRG